MPGAPTDELELNDYLRILRRRWPWVLGPMITVAALAVLLSAVQDVRYAALAQVSLGNSAAQDAIAAGGRATSSRELSNEVDLASSDAVRQEVVNRLGLEPDVTITASDQSDAVLFAANAPSADAAAAGANTWAEVYVATKRQQASESIDAVVDDLEAELALIRRDRQALRRPLDDIEDQLVATVTDEERTLLEAELARLKGDLEPELELFDTQVRAVSEQIADLELSSRLSDAGTARIVQVAAPPQQPLNAPMERNLALGLVVGLILGAAVALLVENLDGTIKGTEDVAQLGIPVLGGIPEPGRTLAGNEVALATMAHPGTPVAEAYQKVRTAVEFALLGRPISSLLVTSANQGDGKTTSAVNLAWMMSAVDHRVALIDVDFRRPRIHDVFGCPLQPGLSDHLRAGVPLNHLAVRIGDAGSRNLVIIPTGTLPPNPGDFVASPSFAALIRELEDQADLVILDAPPVAPVSDALSIGRYVDAVIVVAKARVTTRDQLVDTVENLRQVGADVIGVCVVGIRQSAADYGYGYGPDSRGPRGRRPRRGRRRSTRPSERRDHTLDLRGGDGFPGSNGHVPGPVSGALPRVDNRPI